MIVYLARDIPAFVCIASMENVAHPYLYYDNNNNNNNNNNNINNNNECAFSILNTYPTQLFYYSSYNYYDIIVVNAGSITCLVLYILTLEGQSK